MIIATSFYCENTGDFTEMKSQFTTVFLWFAFCVFLHELKCKINKKWFSWCFYLYKQGYCTVAGILKVVVEKRQNIGRISK